MNIAVLFGGLSPEREVSISGGRAVVEALRNNGHNVIPIDPILGKLAGTHSTAILEGTEKINIDELLKNPDSKKLIECINSEIFDNIDVAFLVLHGTWGEDGRIQALLEMRGIPYTGSGVKASSSAIDKRSSKVLFHAAGIPTPPWVTVRKENLGNYEFYDEIRMELGSKLVVKPNDQGSTIGINIITDGNLDDIDKYVKEAFEYSKVVLVEKFIDGRELTVSIVGDDILPVIEIEPEEGFYDYEHKYTSGKTNYVCPAEITDDIAEFAQSLAYSAYTVLDCSGFARADFRMDDDGQCWCLEMNTIPGFTATSLVPKAAKAVGIEFPELCEKIIQLALDK